MHRIAPAAGVESSGPPVAVKMNSKHAVAGERDRAYESCGFFYLPFAINRAAPRLRISDLYVTVGGFLGVLHAKAKVEKSMSTSTSD